MLLYQSYNGRMMNLSAQKAVPTILSCHLPLTLVEIGGVITFYISIMRGDGVASCGYWTSDTQLHYLLLFMTVVVSLQLFGVFLLSLLAWRSGNHKGSTNAERWAKTAQRIFGCFSSNSFWTEPDLFETIGEIIATVIYERDFTTSDLAAALMLMRILHKAQEAEKVDLKELREGGSALNDVNVVILDSVVERGKGGGDSVVKVTGTGLSTKLSKHAQHCSQSNLLSGEVDFRVLAECSYYAQYSVGMYGWLNACFYGCSWCSCKRLSQVEGDVCCSVHLSSMLQSTNLRDEDIIYANFNESVWLQPYTVVVDHSTMEVVLSFRGTFSPQDFLTDGLATNVPLDRYGVEFGFDGNGQYAHKGIWTCGLSLVKDLKRHNLINALLKGEEPGAGYALPLCYEQVRKGNYKLLINGHSLGGALSAVVGIMLRKEHPTLRVFMYSPLPPFTPALSESLSSFMTSVCLGKDAVPRLQVRTIARLRDDMVNAFNICKISKLKLALKFLCCGSSHLRLEDLFDDPSAYVDEETGLKSPLPRRLEPLLKFGNHTRDETPRGLDENFPKMYPPGRIIHLSKTDTVHKCCGCTYFCRDENYEARWTSGEHFQEIVLSTLMGEDHIPHKTAAVLTKILGKSVEGSKKSHL
jgi:hypothetical protein